MDFFQFGERMELLLVSAIFNTTREYMDCTNNSLKMVNSFVVLVCYNFWLWFIKSLENRKEGFCVSEKKNRNKGKNCKHMHI